MSDGLERLLSGLGGVPPPVNGAAVRADVGRESRKGVPEVILADVKRADDTVAATRAFLETRGRAILSRTPDALAERLRAVYPDCRIDGFERSGIMVIKRPDFQEVPRTGGRVGILSAGTSDIPIAEEAQVVAAEMGCDVRAFYDVGVAGIHRLADPLTDLQTWPADVIIVAAGMDGALPSVVCGLVDVPVIGLPTPIGYGLGADGVAALMTMLQTCAPGLTVVNIGNGVGAGATAGLIANRVAAARSSAGAAANASAETRP